MSNNPLPGKTLVFLSCIEEIPLALTWLQERSIVNQCVFITHRPCVAIDLNERGLFCNPIDIYSSPNECEELHPLALRWARLWFHDPQGKDLSLIDNLSIGFIFMRRFFYQFISLLIATNHIAHLINREEPDTVVYIEDKPISEGRDYVGGGNLFKEILRDFKNNHRYQLICLKNDTDSGKTHANRVELKKKLIHWAKELVIFCIDQCKLFFHHLVDKRGTTLFLPTASDISYLNNPLLQDILKSNPKARLLYGESEMNCYFHPRIIPCDFKKARTPDIEKLINNFKSALPDTRNIILDNIQASEIFTYNGLHFNSRIASWVTLFFTHIMPGFIEELVLAGETLRQQNVRLIIISNHCTSTARMYSLLGSRSGIPVVHCPHGYTTVYLHKGKAYNHPENEIESFPFLSSHEVVGLAHNYEARTGSGIHPEKLIKVGMFQYQIAFADREKKKREARQKLGLGLNEEIIVYTPDGCPQYLERFSTAFTVTGFENFNLCQSLIDLFAERTDSKLAIKFRANDILPPLAEKMVRARNLRNIMITTTGLHDLLLAADALITVNSNTGNEALYYNIPIIQIKIPNRTNLLSLGEVGASIVVENMQELSRTLALLRHDEIFRAKHFAAQQDYLRANNSLGVGESRRLAGILLTMSEQKKQGVEISPFIQNTKN